MLWLITALCVVGTCAAFKVTVPAGRVVAVRGQPIVLGCEFTPDSSSDLSSLVVTWQRKEDSRVVHSFYYKQDQLERQSVAYRTRTALFATELEKGNASLRIEAVGPNDIGQYLCMVSNTKGTDKAQVLLEYGAFYTEPRLSIIANCSNVTVWYEAEGFPKPEVSWLGDQGQNLNHHTELTEGQDGAIGLYYLKSSYVAQSPALSVTFTLKNPLLNQRLQRSVNLTYDMATPGSIHHHCKNIHDGDQDARCGSQRSVIIVLSVVCLLLLATIMFLLIKLQRKSNPSVQYQRAKQENQTENKTNCPPA